MIEILLPIEQRIEEAMASSISSYLGMRRSIPRRNLRMLLRARDQSSAADEGMIHKVDISSIRCFDI